jgi:ATP-dependent RNA helicase RhlE
MTSPQQAAPSFSGLGLSNQILAILERLQLKIPTPIQHQSIPACLDGKDIIGIAQTGTGKTLAFGLPLIQSLQTIKGLGLILTPTRELAQQVEETIRKIGSSLGMTTALLIGGESMLRQIEQLKRQPRILVATPGRLLDHLEQGTARLEQTKILVLDEADRMLDMGFAPQINEILKRVPRNRQTLLYSATMPTEIVRIAAAHMKLPVRVEVAPTGTAPKNVEQEIIVVAKESKRVLLESLLREQSGPTLIFSRTKYGARKICYFLNQRGFSAAEIHSNRSQSQRKEALDGFKRGRYRVLVATDIAARGIDVQNIALVINYDLPKNSGDYVHRIGRTGRAGREGKAVSFATPDQKGDIRAIERLIRKTLKVVFKHPLTR